MPFLIIKENVSLQVQKLLKKTNKRAFLCGVHKGSLTIEAALALPLVIFFSISIIYFCVIFQLQMNIQIKLQEVAGEIGKTGYITEDLKVFNYIYLKGKMENTKFKEYLNKSCIVNGSQGIDYLESTFFDREGVVDIVAKYDVIIPFIPEKVFSIPCIQRVRFRSWIGKKIEPDEELEDDIVYITSTGSVYHETKECSHLKLSISQCSFSSLEFLRNDSGGIYKPCEICGGLSDVENSIVYITESGDSWHSTLSCSGLKRDIIEIPISEVGDRKIMHKM